MMVQLRGRCSVPSVVDRLVLGILVGNTWEASGGGRPWVAQHDTLMDGSIRNGLRV